ncbi:unnamed protein product [Toxocara canis]|uniref:Uncharacterized protein n=1 Tax=Toxocara canis TaxID=6265 RepID=A0A183VF53_TOXCA|nr:unnamed protein product [Toxocara canis]
MDCGPIPIERPSVDCGFDFVVDLTFARTTYLCDTVSKSSRPCRTPRLYVTLVLDARIRKHSETSGVRRGPENNELEMLGI